MKIIMIIIICSVTMLGFSQDRLSRIGGFTSGERSCAGDGSARANQQYEKTLRQASLNNPQDAFLTEDQFKKHCLTNIMQDYKRDEHGFIVPAKTYRAELEEYAKDSTYTQKLKITQCLGNGSYLVTFPDSRDFDMIRLDMKDDRYTDGFTFRRAIVATGETFTYTSVLGAAKRVAVYVPVEPITEEDVITAFRSGEKFKVLQKTPVTLDCAACNSTGWIDGMNGTFKVQSQCPHCKGKRKRNIDFELLYTVQIAPTKTAAKQ